MNELARQWRALAKRWAELSKSVRMAIAATAGLVLVGALVAVALNREPAMSVLFSNVSADDKLRIVERLGVMGVPQRVTEEGKTIWVPQDQVHEVRMMLASEGLPSGPGVGFEVFDEQRFGESELTEEVKYHRALEGELGRTISHLAGVRRARVHLVLPKRSLFVQDSEGASASVVLHLRPGWKVRDEQARGIVHLVAASVRGLNPERVTVLDGEGRRLDGAGDEKGDLAEDALAFRQQVEEAKERAVQQMLDTTLGPGHSLVRVAANVDFTREERTEETYDPQGVAPRSFQITEEGAGAGAGTLGGVPGAASNLPGGAPPENGAGVAQGAKRSETRNFEVSKVLRHSVEPVGRVVGLQVAVVVDGKWEGEGEERTFTPLPKNELNKIRGLVASAVGLDEDRGDRITIESVPFAPVSGYEPSLLEGVLGPYADYVPTAFLCILGLIALLIISRRVKQFQEALREAEQVEVKELPGDGVRERLGLAEGEGGVSGELTAGDQDSIDMEKIEEVRRLASKLAGEQPEAAANVIRLWLGGDSA